MDIKENDCLEIFTDGDRLVLRKYAPYCMACGKNREVIQVGNIKLCEECLEAIKTKWHLVFQLNESLVLSNKTKE
nr:hypothetical protein [uncultured Solibaculum sp.]